MNTETYASGIFICVLFIALLCFLTQRICRRCADNAQYNYFRDLALIGAWVLAAVCAGGPSSRFIVGMAVLSAVLGMVQHVYPNTLWKPAYLLIGFIFALLGPRIEFIGLPAGQYHYLPAEVSVLLTAVWVAAFPVLLQELDNIPGMSGHLLAISFSLMLAATVFSGQSLREAFFMSLSGMMFLGVFWSRHGHMYRRLGASLSAMWGVLVAGTSVLGVSKGIALGALMLLPIGLFAIPIAEATLNFMSRALTSKGNNAAVLYSRLIGRGLDHPSAVRFITSLCALAGMAVAVSQLGKPLFLALAICFAVLIAGYSIMPAIRNMKESAKMPRRPSIWSTSIDNVSMNYALSKARGGLVPGGGARLVSTVNALAVLEAERDERYAAALRSSFLTLADGTGLVWALKLLGTPVQERVAGIDYMLGLARMAAAEGWPVYLLGSRPNIVEKAASELKTRFPDLVVVGYRDGYFDEGDASVAEAVKNSGAKILFVAMGVPKQEIWVAENSDRLGDLLAVGVGGAFDVISGSLKRAPVIMQKMGLEWLYRLLQEPWRWRKDLDLAVFAVKVLLTRVGLYDSKGGRPL